MYSRAFLAAVVSLLVAPFAFAAITVTIELPTANQVTGPGPDARAVVSSTLSLQSVVASVEGRTSALTFDSGKWVGWVNCDGLARGTHTMTVTATDVNANTGSATQDFFLDYYPVVHVTSPLPHSVARPKSQFIATCTDDDPAGCASLRIAAGKNLTTLYQSPNPSSMNTEISGGGIYLVVGTDSAGRNAVVEVPLIREESGRLRTVASAPSLIYDFDGSRFLYADDYNHFSLGIYDIATGAVESIPGVPQSPPNPGFLTPAGAIMQINSVIYEWRSGVLSTPGPQFSSAFRAAGTWAVWERLGGSLREDLTTGSVQSFDATGRTPEPAPNGQVVYSRYVGNNDYDLYRYDGTNTTLLDATDVAYEPRTDGGDVLYWRQQGAQGGNPGAFYIYDGNSSFSISPTATNYVGGHDIQGNWAVFPVPDTSGNAQYWRRAPGASTASRVTVFNFNHYLMRLAPTGEFLYSGNTYPAPGTLMAGTAYDSSAIEVSANRLLQGTFFVGGRWYLAEGRTLFQIEPPNSEISGDHRSDVLWRDTTSGQLELWSMYGATPDLYSFLPAVNSSFHAQMGDFNGDGRADVLWRNPSTGSTSIWFMDTHIIGGANLPDLPSAWETYPGDFNGDGTDDLLLRNTSSGQVSMWLLNQGHIIAGGDLPSLGSAWKLRAGDFNADGKTDVMLNNPTTGDNTIWFLNGRTIIGGKPLPQVAAPWESYAGNFNGDAHADILWRNTSTGDSSIWLLQYGVVIGGGDLPNMPTTAVPYRGDFNGDTKTDLLWHTPNATGLTIMMMNGASVASTHSLSRSANNEVLNLEY